MKPVEEGMSGVYLTIDRFSSDEYIATSLYDLIYVEELIQLDVAGYSGELANIEEARRLVARFSLIVQMMNVPLHRFTQATQSLMENCRALPVNHGLGNTARGTAVKMVYHRPDNNRLEELHRALGEYLEKGGSVAALAPHIPVMVDVLRELAIPSDRSGTLRLQPCRMTEGGGEPERPELTLYSNGPQGGDGGHGGMTSITYRHDLESTVSVDDEGCDYINDKVEIATYGDWEGQALIEAIAFLGLRIIREMSAPMEEEQL